eukprot:11174558-Alexandrium_andersonii.AAC.1
MPSLHGPSRSCTSLDPAASHSRLRILQAVAFGFTPAFVMRCLGRALRGSPRTTVSGGRLPEAYGHRWLGVRLDQLARRCQG